MSAEFYRVLHLLCLVIVTSCFGIAYFGSVPRKWAKILGMTCSVILLISGFALLSKLNYLAAGTWPLWIKLKLGIWIILAASGPVLAKKLKTKRHYGFIFLMTMIGIAIILAVTKIT